MKIVRVPFEERRQPLPLVPIALLIVAGFLLGAILGLIAVGLP